MPPTTATTPQVDRESTAIAIKAPEITAEQRSDLLGAKKLLQDAIAKFASLIAKVESHRKKESSLQSDIQTLQEKAEDLDLDAEIQLVASARQLERIADAIPEAESAVKSGFIPLAAALREAQRAISQVCRPAYDELLTNIASAIAPFYGDLSKAREVAKDSPAAKDFSERILSHGANSKITAEGKLTEARKVEGKFETLLSGGELWRYSPSEAR